MEGRGEEGTGKEREGKGKERKERDRKGREKGKGREGKKRTGKGEKIFIRIWLIQKYEFEIILVGLNFQKTKHTLHFPVNIFSFRPGYQNTQQDIEGCD